ncbi:hypothetical protein [Marinifilum caeruleilacunae]|uniref:Uncharacterized protein n=1 Tax=Marinifilum caeruleilacunae TaxID=2499076 RepID=A0ABX1WUE6_9BACT|nr:hypothetical protein [Marinifilum caeruleilacunae]NOU59647.1 hypothetical protein [Marinifilum caeruleilacunae]
MEFVQHSINWAKGETTEAIITAIFGLLIVICSLAFWKFGNTPNGKALIIPLLIVGIIPLFFGISGAISNNNRIEAYQQAWQENPQKFMQDEKLRVERFDQIFKYTYPMAITLSIGGAILFFLLGSPNWKAISLAMMTMGLMAYFIDHFAAERAEIYLKQIKESIEMFSCL